MKLSKKDLQVQRNRMSINSKKEIHDLRTFKIENPYYYSSDYTNGHIDGQREYIDYMNDKYNDIIKEKEKIMEECFPWLVI